MATQQTECIEWWGAKDKDGYGVTRWQGKSGRVHRVAYLTNVGSIPEGHEIDHICKNVACFNPAHLEPVTHQENVRRGVGSKLRCKHGHVFTELTTYICPRGRRECRICRKNNNFRARAR